MDCFASYVVLRGSGISSWLALAWAQRACPRDSNLSRAISAPGAVGTNLVGHHGLAGEVHEAAGRAQQRGLILVMAGHRVRKWTVDSQKIQQVRVCANH